MSQNNDYTLPRVHILCITEEPRQNYAGFWGFSRGFLKYKYNDRIYNKCVGLKENVFTRCPKNIYIFSRIFLKVKQTNKVVSNYEY